MKISLKIKELRKKLQLTQEEFAELIGKNKKTIVFWENERTKPSKSILLTICNICNLPIDYFKETVTNTVINEIQKDIPNEIISIPYLEWLPEEMRNPKYPDVVSRTISIDDWGKIECLRIVAMNGDSMENYWYKMQNKDVLLIDTSETKVNADGRGVYFATSQKNTKFWVREMAELLDESIEFSAYPQSGTITKVYSKEQLKQVDFKIIGKVIKNVSLKL